MQPAAATQFAHALNLSISRTFPLLNPLFGLALEPEDLDADLGAYDCPQRCLSLRCCLLAQRRRSRLLTDDKLTARDGHRVLTPLLLHFLPQMQPDAAGPHFLRAVAGKHADQARGAANGFVIVGQQPSLAQRSVATGRSCRRL